ncbi:MAG: DUF1444 domain-containing protein [Candidatus Limnocylindrales bacterium]
MERDFGGQDLGDEPAGALRDAPPDIHTPIDANAPVSGHAALVHEPGAGVALTPEYDFHTAVPLLMPALRPVGTTGTPIADLPPDRPSSTQTHTQPLLDEGPCGLPVVYTIAGGGFDVVVNGDHLLSWGVRVGDVQEAALANLSAWSDGAPWTDEVSGDRRLLSSDTGGGHDAARILLPSVRAHLAQELGAAGRVLIGLPERHLLLAGTLRDGDAEFVGLFADFVLEHSGGADEPIDRRVFELVEGNLVEFGG